ncbi:MAG: L,D-transpeptidase family protein [Chloroflexota bacterium]|nr:L,D-transpeptidase family protein [Chloroflexota bacterium]
MIPSSRSVIAALGLCVILFGTAQAEPQEFTVDNTGPFVQVTGPWTSVTAASGFIGSDYLVRPPSQGDATVFWPFPSTTAPGQYEVFARWTSDSDRATDALYFVSSDAGTVPITQNQQSNGGTWQSLGTFDFQPGKHEGVTLSDRANGVVVADAIRWVAAPSPPGSGVSSAAALAVSSPVAASPMQTPGPTTTGTWTVTVQPAELHAGPDPGSDVLSKIPQFSYLQVLGYVGDFAYVYNPRARGTAYASSALLGPSDPPPAWVTAPPPTPAASVELMGRAVGNAQVAFYPVDDKFAYVARLGHNQPILVHDRLEAADGSTWYRVDQGYLAAASVRLPRTPPRTFTGRWLDADLSEPAMVTAYDGNRIALSTLAIKGTIANQTPTGTFTIQRRVADEIMDSGTLGVPANGPGGYHLEHVLFTQYFSSDGASIHYNYWSSNFGYSGSHGCLGLDRTDSEFLWNWASIGTPVSIHT